MKQFGLAEHTMRFLGSCISLIGVILLHLLTTLCLTPLFFLGGLIFNRWLGWTRLAWLVQQMGLRLETVLLNWWTDTLWGRRERKFLMLWVKDAKTLVLGNLMLMVTIALTTWS